MNKKRLFLWFTLISILLTVQCTVDDDQITSPSGGVDQYIVLKSFLSDKNPIFSGGDSTIVRLTILNPKNDLYGIDVTFRAVNGLGNITDSDITDTNGVATGIYTSRDTTGWEIITASTGTKEDTLFLYLVNRVTTLALSINEDSTAILADGKAKVKITAIAKDSLDNPQANLRIFFATDHGTIPGSGQTNENGIVEVMLTSESDSLDIIATIRAGFESFESTAARTDETQNTEPAPATNHLKVFDDELNIRGPRPLKKELAVEIDESDVPVTTAKAITSISGLEDTLQVTFKGVEVNVQRGKPTLLADGEDLADIIVTIVETTTGNPITNYDFNITATKGTIIGNTETDATGRANLQLRSGTTAGISIITVSVGLVTSQTEIEFKSADPTSFTVERSAQFGIADGISGITLTATIWDILNNPVEAEEVVFSATVGELDITSGLSNANGQVMAFLTSIPSVYDSSSRVIAMVSDYSELVDTVEMEFKGIEVNVQCGQPALLADGDDLADIIVTIVETTTGNPITNYDFNITATKGTIIGDTETDATGRANLQLRSGTTAGISIITVSVGLVTSQTEIEFKSADPTNFTVERSAQFGIADGISGITLTATIWDILNNPVEAEEVVFSATVGELDITSGLSNANGQVTAFLTSIPSIYDSTSTVIAMVSDYSELVDTIDVGFKGITVTAEADPDTIVANGFSTTNITATVKRTTGSAGAIPDREVHFISLSDLGSIDSPQITDASGKATAELTAGLFEGTEVIVVAFGKLEPDTVYVEFLPKKPTTLELESDLQSVHADGVSTIELTATATNILDDPVGGTRIYFKSNIPGHNQLSAITDDNGTARVDFPSFASNNNLSAWLYATLTADNQNAYIHSGGYSLATKTAQPIRMNSPAPLILLQQNQADELIDSVAVEFIGITITAEAEDTMLVANGQNTTTIIAEVKETETNITIRNQPVYFTTNRGTITPEDLTDDFGIAEAILTSARFPDTANVRVRYGSGLYDTVSVEYLNSYPVSVTIMADQASILANGLETASISAMVLDTLSNPMQGEAVGFTTDLGTLSDNAAYSDENGLAIIDLYSIADINTHTASVTATILSNPALTVSLVIEFRGVSISTTASEMSITADGQSSTDITVALTETENPFPIANQVINFLPTNTNGTMPRTVTTDVNGIATSTLTSGTLPGTAKIYISTGNSISGEVLEDSISIELLDHNPNQIIVNADEVSILADGSSSTGISAQVVDTLGNPVFGINVSLTANIGNLASNTGSTDEEGFVYTTLTSAPDSVDTTAQIIATCTNFSQIVDTTTVTMHGLTLIINAIPEQISADGSSTSTISINLRETGNNNPIPNTDIILTTSSGTIPSLITTNTSGLAETQLTSNTVAGTATVTATVGISRSTTVEFISTAPDSMRIEVVNSSILANGSSSTDITVIVSDVLDNPVIGTLLNVSTNVGILSNSFIYTDILGEATVSLTSIADTTDTNAVVIYTVIDDTLLLSDSASVEFRGITLHISASPMQIPANGIATAIITAGLQETTRGNPLIGTNIDWATTLGIIPISSVTDNLGFASTTLTSGILPGQATVTANTGVIDTVNISIMSITPESIYVSSSSSSILADGEATTTLTATVADTLGNPVSGTAVGFTTVNGTLSSSSATTNTNGEATVVLTSSTDTTNVTSEIIATVSSFTDVKDSLDIVFRGITLNISASPDRIPADGQSTSTISINLIETTNGNPVIEKVITLLTDRGSIAASATTDANGQAAAILTSGISAGTATVTAIAGLSDSTTVEFSDLSFTVSADTTTTLLADGVSSLQIRAQLQDQITGNPLTDRTIYWTTTLGSIPTSSTTDITGEALASLTAGITAGTAKVKGYYGTSLVDSVSITINATTDSTIILSWYNTGGNPGDGTDVLSVTVILSDGNGNPVSGNTIDFSVMPTSFGSITTGIVTGADGTATAFYTYSSQFADQTVRVQATSQSGDITSYIDIILPEIN